MDASPSGRRRCGAVMVHKIDRLPETSRTMHDPGRASQVRLPAGVRDQEHRGNHLAQAGRGDPCRWLSLSSANLASRSKGLTQKAKMGGWLQWGPIGNLKKRERVFGQDGPRWSSTWSRLVGTGVVPPVRLGRLLSFGTSASHDPKGPHLPDGPHGGKEVAVNRIVETLAATPYTPERCCGTVPAPVSTKLWFPESCSSGPAGSKSSQQGGEPGSAVKITTRRACSSALSA